MIKYLEMIILKNFKKKKIRAAWKKRMRIIYDEKSLKNKMEQRSLEK